MVQVQLFPVSSLTEEQVSEIVALVNRAYSRHNWMFPPDRTDPENYREEADGGEALLLVEQPDNKILATAVFHPKGEMLYLEMVAIDLELQGRGYGKKILEQVEQIARQRGFSKIGLQSVAEIGNVEYYKRHGFQIVSEEVKPQGTWGSLALYTIVTMEKSLITEN